VSTTSRRIAVSWSGGKDAAWTLHRLRSAGLYAGDEVVGLLVSTVPAVDRVAMHGVRVELVRAQAAAAGLPLLEVPLPWPCINATYEAAFRVALAEARARWRATHVAFGDLFLADVRSYRERLLAGSGMEPLFPLWGEPTDALVHEMLAAGVRAHLVCVDPRQLDRELAGAELTPALVAALPPQVDRCGEQGEFHTFVAAGPMLAHAIPVAVGPTVERDGFVFTDLTAA
jgi:uncharacterized protein (TIGR00290 family)